MILWSLFCLQFFCGLSYLRVSINTNAIGDVETLKNLRAAGLNLDELKDAHMGWTALTYCAEIKNVACSKNLLEAGINPNAISAANGWTPLMHASKQGSIEVVELLLAYNADISTLSDNGFTAQQIALQENNVQVSNLLAEAQLAIAITNFDKDLMQAMVHIGAYIDTPNPFGYTALLAVCKLDDVVMAKEFIEIYGADVNHVDNDGWSCLMFAANHNFEAMAGLMLKHGANPLSRSHHGHTARGCAATMNHFRILELLNEHSAEHVLHVQQQQKQSSTKPQQLPHEHLYDKFRSYNIFGSPTTQTLEPPDREGAIVEPTMPFDPHKNMEVFRKLPSNAEPGGAFLEW